MSNFSAHIKINAPKELVWAVLSDLGSIYKWNPGVSHSYCTSDSSGGEGYGDFTTPDVEKVTGNPARPYAAFAQDFAEVFGGVSRQAP